MSLRNRRLAAIRRRIEWLLMRESVGMASSYDQSERDALTWAYNIVMRADIEECNEQSDDVRP